MRYLFLMASLFTLIACSEAEEPFQPVVFEGDVILVTLSDLQNFANEGYSTIHGTLFIVNSNDFEDLTHLKSLKEVKRIIIQLNENLQTLKGLENIRELDFLQIDSNPRLKNLEGLENLVSVSKDIEIKYNDNLTSLTGFKELNTVGEKMSIVFNESLSNLNGLEKLTEAKNLVVSYNPNLKNISGLEGFNKSIAVLLYSNLLLTDFCPLTNFVKNRRNGDVFYTEGNPYNPTSDDLENNKCAMLP
jgi:hypothetical protein